MTAGSMVGPSPMSGIKEKTDFGDKRMNLIFDLLDVLKHLWPSEVTFPRGDVGHR